MNNGNVAHNFVYSKNSKGSNFESINGILYSYNSILAVKKKDLILVSNYISNYSSSSQRHSMHLNNAIGYGTPQRENTIIIYNNEDLQDFYNDRYKTDAVLREITYVTSKIKDMLLKQKRARVHSYFDNIEGFISNANKIIENFGIDKRSSVYKDYLKYSDVEDLKVNYVDLISKYDQEKKAAAKKELNKRHKKVYEKIQNFTGMNNAAMKNYSKKELSSFDFLRIDNDQLCTSQRLCVDLAAAKVLYAAYHAGKNIIGLKIGMYTILSYNEKYITIGCHKILFKELDRVLALDNVVKVAA